MSERNLAPGSLNWYCREYGWPLSTVRNYRRIGLPLDDPAALLVRVMALSGKKPPLQKLSNIANGTQGPLPASPRSSRIDPPPPADSSQGRGESETVEHGLEPGLQAELRRLEQETADSYHAYQTEKLPAEKFVKQKIYLENVKALRALAKDAPKADRDAKKSLGISDVDSTWSRALKEFRSALEAMPRRVATNPMFKRLDPVDVEEFLMKEVQESLSRLETGPWLEAEDPES